jgi:NodT family efflux transporter outer membrane factor (OMF) lipoprotein
VASLTLALGAVSLGAGACAPALRTMPDAGDVGRAMPARYSEPSGATAGATDSLDRRWRGYFTEPELTRLIETALAGNQELTILLQEIEITRNEARAATGEYLPSIGLTAGAGVEKAARYTRDGAVEHALEIKPEREFPEPLTDIGVGAALSWEVDVWGRLRTQAKAAVLRYLATTEGRQFAVTHLVAEIARTYYELVALDRRLSLVEETIAIQERALEVVRLQRTAGRATELAVRRFEGEVQKNRTELAQTRQEIVATENRLNQLVGRYPEPIARSAQRFDATTLPSVTATAPAQLLQHRPDVRRAELELAAANLDVQAARARFYPGLGLSGVFGVRSFELGTLASTPASLLYGLTADVAMPLLNRRALSAGFASASARQQQALAAYQRTLLGAFVEVSTQLARIRNLDSSYVAKSRQVDAMTQSIALADQLFRSARSDYLEVLLTQREAMESRMELVALRQQQLDARVAAFQALGGGIDAESSAVPSPSGSPSGDRW